MFGPRLLRRLTADLTFRIDQLEGLKPVSACLTLITACTFFAAFRASTNNIAVRQKAPAFNTVELFDLAGIYEPLLVNLRKEILCQAVVYGQRSTGEIIESHPKALERFADRFMVTVDDLTRLLALLLGTYCNRYTMLVTTADIYDVSLLESLIADVDVSGQIRAGQMTQMDLAVGIR